MEIVDQRLSSGVLVTVGGKPLDPADSLKLRDHFPSCQA